MKARVLVALCAVACLASGVVAVVSSREPAQRAAAASSTPATPVFSLRRVAGAVSRTVAADRLRPALDGWLAGADNACVAVRDPDGRVLYQQGMDKSLIPASNLKLVTATVALAKFGPDFRYTTPVRASGPVADGSVGDLWLVGSGDPLLATSDFAAIAGWLERPRPFTSIEGLADRIVNAGVKRIGRLLGDESRFDTVRYLPTWAPNYATDPDIGPQSALQLNGGFTQWRPRAIPQTSPGTDVASVLAGLLRARGVAVGAVGEGKAPANASVTVAQIESPTMADIVGVMERDSDNLVAELLVKELGARFGAGGTTAAGAAVEREAATQLGLPVNLMVLTDGSGLDRSNRASCQLMDAVLARAGVDGPLSKGLSVAGSIGTLTKRFVGSPAAGKVRAKTGSLDGVTSLSGWEADRQGQELQFTMLVNGIPTEAAGTNIQNQLVNVLASYPDAPAPDALGPLPVRPAGPG